MILNIDAKFDGKLTSGFKNERKEFSKFSPEHVRNSQNWDLHQVFLNKVEII